MGAASEPGPRLRVAVWGTGNMGTAAIRAIAANPNLALSAVIVSNPDKVGRDVGQLVGLPSGAGLLATSDAAAALATVDALAYMASGDLRPDEALADVIDALAAGLVVVTPSIYPLYDPRSAEPELVGRVAEAAKRGGGRLFVSGIDPGWGNDILAVLISGVAGEIGSIRCQEIFDYSTYNQPDSVRYIVGMGEPMDYEPPMVAPGIPTMVWGGQVRLIGRALGVEFDEITEHVERRALDSDVENVMGRFAAGSQGALRFEVRGMLGSEPVIVIEHVTRIAPHCAPDWPLPPDGGDGVHRVIVEGSPRIVVSVEATDEQGNKAAGGNATAAARLVNSIPWLHAAAPGIYDALDVPLLPARGRLGQRVEHADVRELT